MRVLGLDLLDAALTGAVGGEVRFREPGYALAVDGGWLFGRQAWAQARRYPRRLQTRFWSELADEPLPGQAERTAADLAHAQLQALWSRYGQHCDAVVLAIPAYWSPGQLGLLLGICTELGMPVRGLIDRRVAAIRREYAGRELLLLQASLHAAALSRIRQADGSEATDEESVSAAGIEALNRAVVEAVADAFVREARFDPLHHADSEQFVYDHLHAWLGELRRRSQLALELSHAGHQFSATVTRAAVAERVRAAWQPLLQLLRSLQPADRPAALLLPGELVDYPGLSEALEALPELELIVMDPAAVALAAARERLLQPAGEDYRLRRRAVWDQPPLPAPASSAAGQLQMPTHLVHGERAFPLADRPVKIGARLDPGDFGIQLSGRIAGVSRQHCSLQRDGERILLADHSRYGTRLNGHPIKGSAVLQAGDVITLGSPEQEFLLVAEVRPDGA